MSTHLETTGSHELVPYREKATIIDNHFERLENLMLQHKKEMSEGFKKELGDQWANKIRDTIKDAGVDNDRCIENV